VKKYFSFQPCSLVLLLGRGEKLFFLKGGSHGQAINVCYRSLQICVLLKPQNISISISMDAGDISELTYVWRSVEECHTCGTGACVIMHTSVLRIRVTLCCQCHIRGSIRMDMTRLSVALDITRFVTD
jgi:hypothetical protein